MNASARHTGFSLIELLVVIAIISLLTSILLPGLSAAKQLARSAKCQANLHNLGLAMSLYQTENDGYFPPIVLANHPAPGIRCYFWGTNADPVDVRPSPFVRSLDYSLGSLWCPSFQWGTYVPQGVVNEPTTTYGYNAWCLDPPAWMRKSEGGSPMPRKRASGLAEPSELFVFNDTAMYWSPGGVSILQNSTHLEPVEGTWVQTPTTHFRHRDLTNALCADGHAASFGLEGAEMLIPEKKLGFVGTRNVPHYDQE